MANRYSSLGETDLSQASPSESVEATTGDGAGNGKPSNAPSVSTIPGSATRVKTLQDLLDEAEEFNAAIEEAREFNERYVQASEELTNAQGVQNQVSPSSDDKPAPVTRPFTSWREFSSTAGVLSLRKADLSLPYSGHTHVTWNSSSKTSILRKCQHAKQTQLRSTPASCW